MARRKMTSSVTEREPFRGSLAAQRCRRGGAFRQQGGGRLPVTADAFTWTCSWCLPASGSRESQDPGWRQDKLGVHSQPPIIVVGVAVCVSLN